MCSAGSLSGTFLSLIRRTSISAGQLEHRGGSVKSADARPVGSVKRPDGRPAGSGERLDARPAGSGKEWAE